MNSSTPNPPDSRRSDPLSSLEAEYSLFDQTAYDLAPKPARFIEAFWFWLKLGLISFGGPAGQIALMHQELVERKRWISESRFLHALNYCMMLPGPEAQQLATYMGWLMHRTLGGLVAGVLFVLPSLIILILLSWLYLAYGEVEWVAGVFYGIKPAVTAVVLHAAYRLGSRTLKTPFMWMMAIAAFVAIFAFKVPFPYIVISALLLGYGVGRFSKEAFRHSTIRHDIHSVSQSSIAWLDDQTPTPEHAVFRWSRLGCVLLIGAVLWILPFGFLWFYLGWNHTFTQMAWFFTKAAWLTFGGAYAVLPYIYQGAVEHYGWLEPKQMVDGLALGESTPGPLIMVVAFVAFTGAYANVFLADSTALHPVVAGAIAAILVTWFTFLPSFILIFAGAPFIETTHNNVTFTGPLSAMSAAVVGVILSLALFFGYHVLWPKGWGSDFEWLSALLTLVSLVALFYYKISVMKVIAAGALVGLLMSVIPG